MLTLDTISIEYQARLLLDKISLQLASNEILCLLGTSGSGKTTLLRIIAGLEQGYSGYVRFAGTEIDKLPPYKRNFGLMFQDYALFPHMTVFENVAFGLKMKGMSSSRIQSRVADMLELTGLQSFGNREISRLSGGEKQRVALARSLAPAPDLLMLDEPLGALDAALRERLLDETREIIKSIGISAIYVTHDQQEAYAMADRIAILHEGKIEQIDTPVTLYKHPRTAFAAEFIGLHNIIATDVYRDLFPFIETPKMLLHPDGLRVQAGGEIQGKLISSKFYGDRIDLHVMTNRGCLIKLTVPSEQHASYQPGMTLEIMVDRKMVLPLLR
jgi:ABC-type Fe3+/spermidine/putrescine transport system ATPase subunit